MNLLLTFPVDIFWMFRNIKFLKCFRNVLTQTLRERSVWLFRRHQENGVSSHVCGFLWNIDGWDVVERVACFSSSSSSICIIYLMFRAPSVCCQRRAGCVGLSWRWTLVCTNIRPGVRMMQRFIVYKLKHIYSDALTIFRCPGPQINKEYWVLFYFIFFFILIVLLYFIVHFIIYFRFCHIF